MEATHQDKRDKVIIRAQNGESRAQMTKLDEQIARQRPPSTPSHDLADLAGRAAELFERSSGSRRTGSAKLLRFLVEECKWANGHLTFKWKQPFERVVKIEELRAI